AAPRVAAAEDARRDGDSRPAVRGMSDDRGPGAAGSRRGAVLRPIVHHVTPRSRRGPTGPSDDVPDRRRGAIGGDDEGERAARVSASRHWTLPPPRES